MTGGFLAVFQMVKFNSDESKSKISASLSLIKGEFFGFVGGHTIMLLAEVTRFIYLLFMLVTGVMLFSVLQLNPLFLTISFFASWCVVILAMLDALMHDRI